MCSTSLAEVINSDKSNFPYCELGKLHDEKLSSGGRKNADASVATAKIDAFEQELGPEYDKELLWVRPDRFKF